MKTEAQLLLLLSGYESGEVQAAIGTRAGWPNGGCNPHCGQWNPVRNCFLRYYTTAIRRTTDSSTVLGISQKLNADLL